MMTRFGSRNTQSGVVLFIALVFLVLITVMALTTFTIGKGTSQIVSNMDLRRATLRAADHTNEQTLSTKRIISNPSAPVLDPGTGQYGKTIIVDVNGDGKEKIKTTVGAPTCFMAIPLSSKGIDMTDPLQEQCAYSESTGQKCYKVTFQYPVTAQEEFNGTVLATGAQNAVGQGLYVTADPGGARNVCRGPGGTLLF